MAIPLIDKQDSFEIVRDQIGGILVTELAAQQALAPGAGKDPLDYEVTIFTERHWPVERWLNNDGYTSETAPLCTIWTEQSSVVESSSANSKLQQIFEVTYNLDILAHGFTTDDPGGQDPGDYRAHLRCHRAARLIRNILASGPYFEDLALPGIVWPNTQFENLEFGRADLGETEANIGVWHCRARFRVKMCETSPEEPVPGTINLIHTTISEDGQVIVETEVS